MEEIHNWEFHFSCWHILLFSISKHGWNGRRISCREHLTGVWDYFSISTANMMNSRIRRKRISCQEKQEGVHVAHPLAVALWIKLARKKSFWSPNTKPWRQMVTTSGILVKNKREKGKRNNKGITFELVRTNFNKFTDNSSCNAIVKNCLPKTSID